MVSVQYECRKCGTVLSWMRGEGDERAERAGLPERCPECDASTEGAVRTSTGTTMSKGRRDPRMQEPE